MARPRALPRTARGKTILAAIDARGMTLQQAADLVGVSFNTLHDVIHQRDLATISLRTAERVCTKLDVPLAVISPTLARHCA